LERHVTFLRRAVLLTISAALLAVTGASASSVASSRTAAAAAPARTNALPHAATPKQWAKIVAAAKREGSVTLYTSQNPTYLAAAGKAFESKYGIKVTVNRNIDSVLTTQIASRRRRTS
jgi:iron(III) transport system substrate-binding protein